MCNVNTNNANCSIHIQLIYTPLLFANKAELIIVLIQLLTI